MAEVLRIGVVSDVVCPWCYIGKKRLEQALVLLPPEVQVEVQWHPFQLDPSIPAEGVARQAYFEAKFGGEDRVQEAFERVRAAGEGEGIAFRFDQIPYAINTFSLHKLLHVAKQEGHGAEAHERLFEAYFSRGLDLRDLDTLVSLFAPFGWDRQKVETILQDEAIGYEVRQAIAYYQNRGVSSVPFYVVQNAYGIPGAQPAAYLAQSLLDLYQQAAPNA
jgi:predicted DsbA family dithiol-disulfide isomerase